MQKSIDVVYTAEFSVIIELKWDLHGFKCHYYFLFILFGILKKKFITT